ncbi:MAG: N-acetylmuramoyl-L-alanine amidase [Synergistaceae bacterium]|nr:N-acetylmuramoyl-L-alanine amidase [Synergistaceae bacterium]
MRASSYRIILSVIIALIPALLFAMPVNAGVATLYRGNEALGQVPVMDGNTGFAVSVADAGALLGLNASVVGEELVLSRGNDTLRVVLNAVAAWYNHQLIPLYGASYVQDGRWWLDVPSSLSLLQYFAGRGIGNRLRVEETSAGTGAPAAPPVVPVPVMVTPAAAAPVTDVPAVIPAETEPSDRVIVVSEPVRNPPAPNPPSSSNSPNTDSLAAQTIQASIGSVFASSGASNAPGELRAVRWSVSREKIRAVLDCSDGTNPEGRVVSGKIAIPFASVVDNLQGVPSPYENVTAELVRNADGTGTLLFSAAGVRVERLALNAPRRIVLDFIFNAPTVVREVPRPGTPVVASPVPAPGGAPRRPGSMLVVLDPGHGGKDPGAVGNNLREKDINLAIGLKMEKALQNKGFDVKMTRRADVYLTLRERTDFANKENADMFVSIHANALPPGRNAAGFEIYLMALPTDEDALALAKIENQEYMEDKTSAGAEADRRTDLLLRILGDMQQNNKINESTVAAEVLFKAGNRQGIPMKRVAQAPFYVLRGAAMPAVLLETGFISNPTEAKLLGHAGYQQRIADAMAEGIYNYLKQ